jgi:formylglycine-generating enzyme required for sulfatase activity
MSGGCGVVPKGIKKTEEAPRAAACEAGKERNEDTAGRCCYAGQVWASGRCVGLITASACPAGYKLTSDKQDCEEAGCSGGKKKLGVGQCCWEGQAWSKVAGKCVGAPQCPPSYKASGEDCRAPVPADYEQIPAGSFTMGSTSGEAYDDEKVVHRVTISRGFFMKKTEVTQGEWRSVMESNPSDCDFECSDDRPVNNVSWEDSLTYLNKLSEREGLEACYAQEGGSWRWVKGLECAGYRLPTEAEWEYATRGGTTEDRYGSLDDIAWYRDNSGAKTKPVGTKTANVYGLYDMLGNVCEWTWDAYGAYSSGDQEDPIGGGLEQDPRARRVYRGCGWIDGARYCRAAGRDGYKPGRRFGYLGLRPARSDR